MLAFVCFAAFTAFIFMWVQSLYILIPLTLLYAFLFIATKWDQNFFQVFWITASKIRRGKNTSLWGGNSYEP
jgi:type IV secretory pathway VirB3-like protein